ncbi:MAG: FtsX-like permease family protein [Vicinamibacteria bacterium]
MTESTAHRFFDGDALGRTLSLPRLRDGKTTTVDATLVGVVKDVKYSGLASAADDVVYVPFAQQPWSAPFAIVRTAGDPVTAQTAIRKAIAAADPSMVIGEISTVGALVSEQAAGPRLRTMLLSSIAIAALGIAVSGLYGLLSYTVARRTREIGIRTALGATPKDVTTLLLREGVAMVAVGVGVGLACAWAASRAATSLVFGVSPEDPLSFAAAAAGLSLVALLASYAPARRASRTDPVAALRAD